MKDKDIYTISPFKSGGFAVKLMNKEIYQTDSFAGKTIAVFDTFDEADEFVQKNKYIISAREELKNRTLKNEEIPF